MVSVGVSAMSTGIDNSSKPYTKLEKLAQIIKLGE